MKNFLSENIVKAHEKKGWIQMLTGECITCKQLTMHESRKVGLFMFNFDDWTLAVSLLIKIKTKFPNVIGYQ